MVVNLVPTARFKGNFFDATKIWSRFQETAFPEQYNLGIFKILLKRPVKWSLLPPVLRIPLDGGYCFPLGNPRARFPHFYKKKKKKKNNRVRTVKD